MIKIVNAKRIWRLQLSFKEIVGLWVVLPKPYLKRDDVFGRIYFSLWRRKNGTCHQKGITL